MKICRVGVVGVRRGSMIWKYCQNAGNARLVAVCDKWEQGLEDAKKEIGSEEVTYYTSYEAFLQHDMDVVFLANYATEHAPFAVAAMKAGKDVVSEVLPVQTMAQAVALIECVESTGKKYCYSENYCYMGGPREMKKQYDAGLLGEFEYGEGEYMHNCEPIWHEITYGDPKHWRNTMSAFYYCTHSIGPLLHITGMKPVSVVGFELPYNRRMARMGAKAGHGAVEMITLENGSVIKSLHGIGCSRNSVWYSVYGEKGRMETAREDAEQGDVSRIYSNVDSSEENFQNKVESYLPEDELTRKASEHGHGGSDYVCLYNIFEYMNDREGDVIDVYEALSMWMPGFFGYLSVLEGGVTKQIPDLKDPKVRDLYREDNRCTDPGIGGDQLLPGYSKGNPKVEEGIYAIWKQRWEEMLRWNEAAEPLKEEADKEKCEKEKEEPRPQLIMRWKNDGEAAGEPALPEGVSLETFASRPGALEDWLDIVQYGLTGKREDEAFYRACMSDRDWYDEAHCYFLIKEREAAATITVINNPVKKEGYIHMVACKPEYRGMGLGNLLNEVALSVLKKEAMETAYLTTDDWRIPAIKSYLKAGFEPDLSTEGYIQRWKEIYHQLGR